MRFRGKMMDSHCMKEFSNTLHILSKLGKDAVIFLHPKRVSFIIFDDTAPRRVLARCVMEQKHFFNEYDVFGVSEEFNQICLKFPSDLLAKATCALKSPHTSRSIKIKLTKKKTPCLTCEIEMPTLLKNSRVCTHDIPVEVISPKDWPEFQLPDLPSFDLSIQMPQLKRLKTVCDKMRCLSSQLIFEVNTKGILVLRTETDLATVATYFINLKVESSDKIGADQTFEVRVDIKKIIGFLSVEQINPTCVKCNIVNKKLIFMKVIHDSVALHYVIPGIFKC